MAECLNPEDWLSTMQREYLRDFVAEGGAAVKFIVPLDGNEFSLIKSGLQNMAGEENYYYVSIDAASTRIHLIEQVFFQAARQIDWDGQVLSFLSSLLQNHYSLPEKPEEFTLRNIAQLNGYEEREIRIFINNRLKESLFKNYALAQEFRIAMLLLCRYQLDAEEVGTELDTSLKAWLRGDLKLISALKRALIFQKINRSNARHMLYSLAHWLRLAGKNGLVLVLDISRYLLDRPKEPDGNFYYSTSALLDCYEVLRQFVDGMDESAYCFTAVLAPPRFLDESDRRSVDSYEALKLRIWNEVHDRVHINPLSSLVRVSCCQRGEQIPMKAVSERQNDVQ